MMDGGGIKLNLESLKRIRSELGWYSNKDDFIEVWHDDDGVIMAKCPSGEARRIGKLAKRLVPALE